MSQMQVPDVSVGVGGFLVKRARLHAPSGTLILVHVADDGVVLLSALAAEGEWREQLGAVARDKFLRLDGEVACRLILQTGVDRIAAANELMQAKCEHRESGLRMADLRAKHQVALNRRDGRGLIDSRK